MFFILAVLGKHWVYSGFVEIADVFVNVDLRTEPHFFEVYYIGIHAAKQFCEFRYVVIVSPVAYVDPDFDNGTPKSRIWEKRSD